MNLKINRIGFLFLAATVALATPAAGQSQTTQRPAPQTEARGPRPEHKPYVRWWWLGSAVDREGLNYNLTEFARKGIGGVEITPIYGVKGNEANDLEYLSPAWMEAYRYTVERGAELGIQVDMSNCTGWPFGGPWVSTDESAQKYLLEKRTLRGGERLAEPLRPTDAKQQPVATLEALQAVNDKGKRIDLTARVDADGRLDWQAPAGEWTLYALYAGRTFQMVKRAAPGGVGYVLNHYNRDAVQHYLSHFDEAFAASDAPWPDTFFNDSFEVYGSSWDKTLLAEFERDHGYRLQDYLPEFAAEGADDRSARIVRDYRQTLADMLLRNFTTVWADWAHSHGSRVRNQAHGSPGNIFDFYAAVDIPECESFGRTEFDIPGLRRDPDAKHSDADPAVLKFASSAAHVTGKPLTSCETLTWLTEHFRTSLASCKPEIDQILASGVNHVYFHGAPYSPRNAVFPGWLFYASINMSPTAPLWRDAGAMLDYIARSQAFLQEGEPDNELLLYIPMEDISDSQRGRNLLLFDIHKMDKTMPELKHTMNTLVCGGYDADYISDRYLTDAVVRDGAIVTSGGTRYKAIILPNCRLMPEQTFEKMLALAHDGATVIFAERYPEDVPGFSKLKARRRTFQRVARRLPAADFTQTEIHSYGAGRIVTGNDLHELAATAEARYEPLKKEGCQLIRRRSDDGYRYFISLLDGQAIDGTVEVGVEADRIIVTDPLNGRRGIAKSRPTGHGTTEFALQLQPGQSLLLECLVGQPASQSETESLPEWACYEATSEPVTGHGWQLDFPQSLPAVKQQFAIAEPHSWTTLTPLPDEIASDPLHTDDDGLAALNAAAQRNARALETERALADLVRLCGTGRYTATFTVDDPRAADAWLLRLGDVHESARIRINGHEAGTAWSVPFEIDVTEWLAAGDNRIEIEVTNLPANLIADLDRRGIEWRIFKDANVVSATGKRLDTSAWPVDPAGLTPAVKLYPVKIKNQ